MNNWQETFNIGIDLFPVLLFLGLNSMIRPFIEPELEKILGRKPTDWEWEYYLQESNRKAKADSQQKVMQTCRQWLIDRQIIHDFVWKPEV
jgi:hypothetical protein